MINLFDLGFRFGAIALLSLLGILLLRQGSQRLPALVTVAFALGIGSYLLCSGPFWSSLPRWLQAALLLGCIANPLLFWLLARSIFEDGFRLQHWHALLVIAVEALGFWYVFGLRAESDSASQTFISATAGALLQLIAIALVIGALVTAFRGRAPDLVESRRKFRVLFVSVAGAYMIFVILVELLLRGAAPHPVASMLNAGAIFAIVFTIAVSLLSLKYNLLLEPVRPLPASVQLDASEQALLQRLDQAIANKVYRQEGLTIARLARELNTQEHRLRALINAKMGFRNFNDFLNRHRLGDACAQLADPAKASIPVLTIALNLGYGSIGPFNRAFKQATGLTPTQFRRRELGDSAGAQAEPVG